MTYLSANNGFLAGFGGGTTVAEEGTKDFEQEINEPFKTAKKVESEDGGKWEHLQSLVESKEQSDVKIIEVVKGGYIVYLEDTHVFIPASQFPSSYVGEFEDYANKHITVVVVTADLEKKRLTLSHRVIEQEEKEKEKAARLVELKVGDVLDGRVESLKDYDAFIDLGNVTGLLYVSQISRKRARTPVDVLKEDQEVRVKIIKISDGKISLSMRAPEEPDDHFSGRNNTLEETGGFKYGEKTYATANLGDLLKNIKL